MTINWSHVTVEWFPHQCLCPGCHQVMRVEGGFRREDVVPHETSRHQLVCDECGVAFWAPTVQLEKVIEPA